MHATSKFSRDSECRSFGSATTTNFKDNGCRSEDSSNNIFDSSNENFVAFKLDKDKLIAYYCLSSKEKKVDHSVRVKSVCKDCTKLVIAS